MPKPTPFSRKLLARLERIDPAVLKEHLEDIFREQELYAQIFDHLGEGVLVLGPGGRIEFSNPRGRNFLGLESSARNLSNAHADSEIKRFMGEHLERASGTPAAADFRILTPSESWIRISLIPIESARQNLVVILPLRESSRAETAEGRMTALSNLAAGIAHEIGNPLNSISIHLQLLKKELSGFDFRKKEKFEKTLEVLSSETARLDRIVRAFLKATRLPPLRFRTENLNSILENALSFMRPELEENRIRVHFSPSGSLPAFLADRERMHQVFINLIKNAMEAMPKGGSLWIASSHRGRVAMLTFRDQGVGIQEKDLPHIFEPYFTTRPEGSGLGLLIVYQTVREHGGRIEVESKPGKGTTFTLLLPVRKPKLQIPHLRAKS